MQPIRLASIPALAAAALCLAGSASAQDPQAGAKVFETYCSSCHALAKPMGYKPAPRLNGIIGRKAGGQPGSTASLALKAWGKVWTPALLNAYIADPGAFVPGTTMMISLKDPKKRADLIAFLSQQK